MGALFSPAMFLMDRLKFPVKFSLIFSIVLIPLITLSVIFVNNMNAEILFLEHERMGLAYIKTVRQPIEHIQQHRGMTAAYLNGASDFKARIMSKRQDVDKYMDELAKIDQELGDFLQTQGMINRLQLQWNSIKANSLEMKSANAFKAHSTLVAAMLDLMVHVADSSKITLDPALDSYYIGNALVIGLPNMIENMGQARAVGSGVAAKGEFNEKNYVKLSVLANNINTFFKGVRTSLEVAYEENANASQLLKGPTDSNNEAVKEIQTLLYEKLLDAKTITVDSSTVFDSTTRAISGSYKLYDSLVPVLDKLFVDRITDNSNATMIALSIITTAICLVAYLLIGLYLAVNRSIQNIGETTGKLADGDLTVNIKLLAHDEMRSISDNFNTMAEQFAALIQQIISTAGQLATATEEVSSIARESATNIERQRLETDSVATAINEMNATVQEVASSATNAASAATNADNEAKGGKAIVESASAAIAQLAQEVENAGGVIQAVEKDSESIGSVLDVIKGIAEQTNLLALNAAIEAARAGEQGRGFAVVADEVRTLASRTQQSTQDIEGMINKLQVGSRNAVEVMQKSREQAQKGVEQAKEAGQALEAITRAVTTINEMNTQIASAAEEQSAVAEEINKNVTSISQISEQTSTGAKQTTTSAEELAKLASDLQNLVSQFKIQAS